MQTQLTYDNAAHFIMTATEEPAARQLYVKVGTCIKLIQMADIVYVQAAGNYVGIVMVSGETIHTKETIFHVAERLPHHLFVRIHRSYIVNIRYIREIKSQQNNYAITVANDVRILSGTTYRKRIRERFSVGLGRASKSFKNQPAADAALVPTMSSSGGPEPSSDIKTRIRAAVPEDEATLTFLGKMTFMETYTGVIADENINVYYASHDAPTTYRAWLEDKTVRVWIVEVETGNIPVGYMVLTPPNKPFVSARRDRDLEIQRIYLLKAFQGRGLGKQLITQAVQDATRAGCHRLLLGDNRENRPAIAFYQHMGFRPIGEYLCRVGSRDYDDIVFSLEIEQPSQHSA